MGNIGTWLANFFSNFLRGLLKDKRHEKSIADNAINEANAEQEKDALDKIKTVQDNGSQLSNATDDELFDGLRNPTDRKSNDS